MTTRILRLPRVPAAARPSQNGADPAPAITIAESRKKIRLVSIELPPLEFRGADHQSGDEARVSLSAFEPFFNRLKRLFRRVAVQQVAGDLADALSFPSPNIGLHALQLPVCQRIGETDSRHYIGGAQPRLGAILVPAG